MTPDALFAVREPAVPGEGLSAAKGALLGEEGEVDQVWDGLPAGSAAVAVLANAEAKARESIRI